LPLTLGNAYRVLRCAYDDASTNGFSPSQIAAEDTPDSVDLPG
jgi:hypothetical protein